MRRVERSLKNGAAALLGQAVSLGLAFVTRVAFIQALGKDYLGVNEFFRSVLSMLSVTELGLGSAITFALYRPLAAGDTRQISALMNLYARAYRAIAGVVAALGLLLFPLWRSILGQPPGVERLRLIYLLYLAGSVSGYFLSYKRSLIAADQLDSVNALNQCAFSALQSVVQILVLQIRCDYLLFLAVQITCTFLSNLAISRRADRMYPYLRQNRDARLDSAGRASLRRNVGAMFLHQVGGVAVTGTDNAMIAWVDVGLLGVYSNYALIVQTLSQLLRALFGGISASVGNMVASEDAKRQYETYQNMEFITLWIYGFCAVALSVLMGPFIGLLPQEGYLLPGATTALIVANFYLFGLRQTNIAFINASGLFYRLRFKSLLEAMINLAASLFFLLPLDLGLNGVLLGTIVSTLSTNFWWEPFAIYRHLFNRPLARYFRALAPHVLALGAALICTQAVCERIPGGGLLSFAGKAAACAILPNAVLLLFFGRTRQFRYACALARRLLVRLARGRDRSRKGAG